jgi:hypothetical protein
MSVASDTVYADASPMLHSNLASDLWVDSICLKLEHQSNAMQLSGNALLFNAGSEKISGFIEVLATATIQPDSLRFGKAISVDESQIRFRDTIALSPTSVYPLPVSFLLGTPSDTSKRQYRIQFLLNGKLIHLSQTFLR